MSMRNGCGVLGVGLWVSLLLLQAWPQPAAAAAPVGACCFSNGACMDIVDATCLEQGGEFIGTDTTCANVNCGARSAVPMFSILGMVGIVGALGGLGAYRLIRKRK